MRTPHCIYYTYVRVYIMFKCIKHYYAKTSNSDTLSDLKWEMKWVLTASTPIRVLSPQSNRSFYTLHAESLVEHLNEIWFGWMKEPQCMFVTDKNFNPG